MAGILDKLQGLLSNPTVQGIGGAAAAGVNPLIGLLAGPGIKASRDRRELQNEDMRRRLDARKELRGLLGERQIIDQPAADISIPGIGGEAGLQQRFERRPESIPRVSTERGQLELQGLLTDIAPEAAANAQLSRRSSPSSFMEKVNFLQSAGLLNEERLLQVAGANDPETHIEALMAEVQLMSLRQRMQQAEDEDQRTRLENEIEDKTIAGATLQSLTQLDELAELNEVLQSEDMSILLQPGIASQFRQGGAGAAILAANALGFGGSVEDLQRQMNALERFNTISNSLAILGVEGGRFSGNTDARFRAFRDTKPTPERGVATNALTIADTIEASLALADARRITVPNRARYDTLIRNLRQQHKLTKDRSRPAAEPAATGDLPFNENEVELVPSGGL